MESLTEAKKPMILRLSILALFLCLAVIGPAEAQWWPFTKKKDETSQQTPSEPSKVFIKKQQDGMPEKKWALDGVFNPKGLEQDVLVNGVPMKGLKPYMLNSSYIPQTPEEMAMIMFAHKGWEIEAVADHAAAAEARAAAAQKKADMALIKMQQEGAMQMANAAQYDAAQKAAAAQGLPVQQQQQQQQQKPPKVELFNRTDDIGKPSKVFQNYR
jgi:hypothetical protein